MQHVQKLTYYDLRDQLFSWGKKTKIVHRSETENSHKQLSFSPLNTTRSHKSTFAKTKKRTSVLAKSMSISFDTLLLYIYVYMVDDELTSFRL